MSGSLPPPNPREVWTHLRDKLRKAELELSPNHGRAWELAKFALSAWIDEVLRSNEQWSQNKWLQNNFMEFENFKTLDGHQMFFVNAKEALTLTNGDDAIETFYVCAMLGFRGFYGQGGSADPTRVETTAKQFDLPSSFAEWAYSVGVIIRERRQASAVRGDSQVPERTIVTARPFWSRSQLLWPWLLVALFAGLNVIVYYYLR